MGLIDSQILQDRARSEKAARIAQTGEGINPDYVSLVENQDPPDYVADTGVPYGQKPLPDGMVQRLFWDTDNPGAGWQDLGSPVPSKVYVDDKASLLSDRIDPLEDGQSAGVIGYADKATMDADTTQDEGALALVTNDADASLNGWYRWSGSEWVASSGFFSAATVQDWALSEAYTVTNIVYDADGFIESADLTWPDGEAGSISDVITDDFGITSIRYNRPGDKYITIDITRDGDGNVTETTSTATGF